MEQSSNKLFPEITRMLKEIDISGISAERKKDLLVLVDFIQQKVISKKDINLNFICTHNSRRSHLSQVWAQTISTYFNLSKVQCYSGGTKATALFPIVAKTLEETGFKINKMAAKGNPVFIIKAGENELPVIGFSKTFDHPFNPKCNFAAIMTCSQANEDCPFIAGAAERIALPFDDPKEFDNTPEQAVKYKERSRQIATELFFVFSKIEQ